MKKRDKRRRNRAGCSAMCDEVQLLISVFVIPCVLRVQSSEVVRVISCEFLVSGSTRKQNGTTNSHEMTRIKTEYERRILQNLRNLVRSVVILQRVNHGLHRKHGKKRNKKRVLEINLVVGPHKSYISCRALKAFRLRTKLVA